MPFEKITVLAILIVIFIYLFGCAGSAACGTFGLHCGALDLVPWPGIEPRAPALEVLANGPPGCPLGCHLCILMDWKVVFLFSDLYFLPQRKKPTNNSESIFFFSSTSLLLPTHLPPPSCMHAQSCNPMDCSLLGSCPWTFPGKNTGVCCHILFQVHCF